MKTSVTQLEHLENQSIWICHCHLFHPNTTTSGPLKLRDGSFYISMCLGKCLSKETRTKGTCLQLIWCHQIRSLCSLNTPLTPKNRGLPRESTDRVGRSGGGSQVRQEEWNKQKANEYKGCGLAEWDAICRAQTHCFHMGKTECFKGGFFVKQDKRWDSPQTMMLNPELQLNSLYGYCFK